MASWVSAGLVRFELVSVAPHSRGVERILLWLFTWILCASWCSYSIIIENLFYHPGLSRLFLFRFTWLISPIVDGIFMMKLLWYIFVLLDSHSSHCYSFLLTNWRVIEYHVDGFRFDLASVLCRGTDGSPLNAPPIIRVSHVYTFKYILSKQMIAT